MKKINVPKKFHIKKGDLVRVLTGKDKGKQGEVLQVNRKKYRAVVDKINIVKKHLKPTNESQGGINEVPAPIHISNLALVDPKTGDITRVGRKLIDGKLVRYSKKTGEILD